MKKTTERSRRPPVTGSASFHRSLLFIAHFATRRWNTTGVNVYDRWIQRDQRSKSHALQRTHEKHQKCGGIKYIKYAPKKCRNRKAHKVCCRTATEPYWGFPSWQHRLSKCCSRRRRKPSRSLLKLTACLQDVKQNETKISQVQHQHPIETKTDDPIH